jgi:hypothetical protein
LQAVRGDKRQRQNQHAQATARHSTAIKDILTEAAFTLNYQAGGGIFHKPWDFGF